MTALAGSSGRLHAGQVAEVLTHVLGLPDRGPVASSVVGGGQVLVNSVLRKFSFTALDQRRSEEAATVVGQFDMFDPTTGGRVHGIVTCFLIDGNGARVGGQVTQPPPANGVVEVGFQVVDNRPPGNTADQMSDLITHGAGQAGNILQTAFCDGQGPDLDLTNIEGGNIEVRNHPPSGP